MTAFLAIETPASCEEHVEVFAIQIADESCRVDIECRARSVPSNYPAPVYDVSELEPDFIIDPEIRAADQEAVDRAVRYLDMRGLLVRPIAGQPHFVAFLQEA